MVDVFQGSRRLCSDSCSSARTLKIIMLSVFSSPKVSQTPRGEGASSASSLQSDRNGSVVLTQV